MPQNEPKHIQAFILYWVYKDNLYVNILHNVISISKLCQDIIYSSCHKKETEYGIYIICYLPPILMTRHSVRDWYLDDDSQGADTHAKGGDGHEEAASGHDPPPAEPLAEKEGSQLAGELRQGRPQQLQVLRGGELAALLQGAGGGGGSGGGRGTHLGKS